MNTQGKSVGNDVKGINIWPGTLPRRRSGVRIPSSAPFIRDEAMWPFKKKEPKPKLYDPVMNPFPEQHKPSIDEVIAREDERRSEHEKWFSDFNAKHYRQWRDK